jgi:glucans biosynthesis protein C
MEQADIPGASGPGRLLYIDNIRLTLITLVVVGHLAITYMGLGDWYYKEAGSVSDIFKILLIPFGAILSASLLGLFSLIAGYFTPRPYDRKGPGPFLLDRIKRLAIPLAVYELILNPAICYVRDANLGSFQVTYWEYLRMFFSPLKSFGSGPVWYLEMLLIFSIAYAGWRLLTGAIFRGGRRSEARVPGNGAIALFALGLGLATFIVRIWAPVGVFYEPWHQEFAHYPQYIAMFVVGILSYRHNGLAVFPSNQVRLWRWLSPLIIVTFGGVAGAAGAFRGALDERAAGGFNWLSLMYSMWEAWTCVIVSILVLVWFRRRFNRQGRLGKEMAASAFGVYVLHPAIIVPLSVALSGISMNPGFKFLWVTPIAVALCFLVAHILRKLPLVRGLLS